jgi:hypothetical protein
MSSDSSVEFAEALSDSERGREGGREGGRQTDRQRKTEREGDRDTTCGSLQPCIGTVMYYIYIYIYIAGVYTYKKHVALV